MPYVYLLQSIPNPKKRYIGKTKNLKNRLFEHNSRKSWHTSKFKPWKIEIAIFFSDEVRANEFEYYLKSGSGHAFANRHLWPKEKKTKGYWSEDFYVGITKLEYRNSISKQAVRFSDVFLFLVWKSDLRHQNICLLGFFFFASGSIPVEFLDSKIVFRFCSSVWISLFPYFLTRKRMTATLHFFSQEGVWE